MDKKLLAIAVVALLAGGAALANTLFGKTNTPSAPAEIIALQREVSNLKSGLPPTWGGWPAAGYMLRVKNGPTIYFSADTDLMLNWDAIREYYKPDIVIATNSVLYQMGVQEWIYAVNKIKPKYVLASHHSSFPFYPKTDDVFAEEITKNTKAVGVKLPPPGQELELMGVKITWLGHASFLIETSQGSRIVFDPEWSAVNIEDFPAEFKKPEKMAADLILISHGHFDHFDPEALKAIMVPAGDRVPHTGMIFELGAYAQKLIPEFASKIVLFNMGTWIDKKILEEAYGVEMSNLDDIDFSAIFATHSSGVFSPIK